LKGKTVLVIAHRMRTVQAADHIVVLKDGRVAEEGAPADLMARRDGIFRHMAELQGASAEWTL
ncbi:MAG: ABC transporter ATP-binding protein, partial [Clostridia bacterium]|nr:ABC transporter ATP-binding protein [Clostridia bacterium]